VYGVGASGGKSSRGLRLGLLVVVAAIFALIPASQASAATFKLSVEIVPKDGGEVLCEVEGAEVDCEESFEEEEEVTLIALPEVGYELVGFSGACDSVFGEECLVVMEGATSKKVTVTFKLIEYGLKVEHKGSGSGTVECEIESVVKACAKTYPEGTLLILVAKAAPGSEFAGWGVGDCEAEPGEAECELEMYEDHVVIATFGLVEEEESNGGGGSGGGSGGDSGSTQPPKPEVIAAVGPGKAKVGGAGLFKGGKATLRISCRGGGACKGAVKLIAKLEVGHEKKKVTVGKASFSLAAGASKALVVKLSAPAKKLLGKGRALTAMVSGNGVTASKVKITPSAR
jgi:hypothetical protein